MLNNQLLTGLANSINRYAATFRDTGDLQWLVRYAQESALYHKFAQKKAANKSYFTPITIGEFSKILQFTNDVALKDEVQGLLSKITSQALLRYYVSLDDNRAAFRRTDLAQISEALVPDLLLDEQQLEEVGELYRDQLSKTEVPEKYRAELEKIANDQGRLRDAINYVLTKTYLAANEYNVYKNPILMIVPANKLGTIKTAAPSKKDLRKITPDKRGPRLSDLIEAIKIISGKYTLKFRNINAQIEHAGSTRELEQQRTATTRTIIVLDSYIDYLTRMKQDLSQFMKSDVSHPYLTWEGASDFVTDDPLVRSSIEDPGKLKDLFRQPPVSKKTLKFPVKLWNGSEKAFGQFDLPQTEVARFYVRFHMKEPEYVENLTASLQEHAQKAVDHYRQANGPQRIEQLRALLPGMEVQGVVAAYQDIVQTLQGAIPPVDAATKEQANEDLDAIIFMEEQGIPHNDRLVKYEEEFVAEIANAKQQLTGKYSPYLGKNSPQDFVVFLNTLLREDVATLTPTQVRQVRTYDNYSFPEGKEGGPARTKDISELLKGITGDIVEVFESDAFQRKFVENEADIEGYEHEYNGRAPTEFELSVEQGVRYLESDESRPLRESLGIVDLPIGTREEFTNAFDGMAHVVFYNNSPSDLQKKLGSVPLQSLYAYMAKRYISVMDRDIACVVACRFSGAKESVSLETNELSPENIKALRETAPDILPSKSSRSGKCLCRGIPVNQEAFNEALHFVIGGFQDLKQTTLKDEGGNRLPSFQEATAMKKIESWHTSPMLRAQYGEEGLVPNFTARFMDAGKDAFGVYIRDNARNKVRSMLKYNLQDKERTNREGREFEWDDPINPKPTNLRELAHVVGAFADPAPSLGSERTKKLKKERSEDVLPGESFVGIEGIPYDTATKHMERLIVGNLGIRGGYINPTGMLRSLFMARKEELIEEDPVYARYIVPFDIHKGPRDKNPTENPFKYGYFPEETTGKEPTELAPGSIQIRSKADAFKFLDSLDESIMSKALVAGLKKFLTSIDGQMFSSNEAFHDYFSTNIGPLISIQGADVDSVLELLVPGRAKSILPDEDQQVVDVRAKLNGLSNQILKLVQEEPQGFGAVEKNVATLTEALQQANEMFDYINQLDESIRQKLSDVYQKLVNVSAQAGQILETRQNMVRERKEVQEVSGLEPLMNLINQILEAIQNPNFVVIDRYRHTELPREVVDTLIRADLLSLVGQGHPDQVVHEDAVAVAMQFLNQFLQAIRSNTVEAEHINRLSDILDKFRKEGFSEEHFTI